MTLQVKTEARLLETTEAELALQAKDRAKAYASADPEGLARSLPGIGEVGAPNLVAAVGPGASATAGSSAPSAA